MSTANTIPVVAANETGKSEKTDLLQWHPYESSTYAAPHHFITKHLHFDWTVDFETSTIKGFVDLTMSVPCQAELEVILRQIESKGHIERWAAHPDDKDDVEMLYEAIGNAQAEDPLHSRIHLDTRDLDIEKVLILTGKDESTAIPIKYSLAPRHFSYGSKLTLQMDAIFKVDSAKLANQVRKTIVKTYSSIHPAFKVDEPFVVRIYYATRPDCAAAQWLPPSQTADGVHSYLFTQCQSIYARSLFPCQDTPGVKATYSAKIRVPEGYTGLMSAVEKVPAHVEEYQGRKYATSEWEQKVAVSCYLIVIVVGHLASRDLSARCRIWSEPEMIEACAWEFADVEKFVTAAEELCGSPYSWGRYDMVVMPFSFANGGMENTNLTFVTSSLVCGDRSLCDVILHEIAHSWTVRPSKTLTKEANYCRVTQLQTIRGRVCG